MVFLDILKSILFGLVEGVTEWLPVSSTGHLILVDEFAKFKSTNPNFFSVFEVVIQLGAIMAVVCLYSVKLNPFSRRKSGSLYVKKSSLSLWTKIFVACLPAAIVGGLLNDEIDALFYNPLSIAIALIVVGVIFIIIEKRQVNLNTITNKLSELSYKSAFIIGLFQLAAAIFPGTSRSGATIIGALLIGVARPIAAEFTFFLAVPVMFGASLLKLIKYNYAFSASEVVILIVGSLVAYLVSLVIIKFLMAYIKKHDFKIFGYYRIVLGIIVLIVFGALGKF